MSWSSPTSVEEMRSSIHARFVFRARRFDLAADYVAVLSVYGVRGTLGRAVGEGHALSDHVLTGAEIEAAILARLESKSSHYYQWSRGAAANEASYAVMEWLDGEGLL